VKEFNRAKPEGRMVSPSPIRSFVVFEKRAVIPAEAGTQNAFIVKIFDLSPPAFTWYLPSQARRIP